MSSPLSSSISSLDRVYLTDIQYPAILPLLMASLAKYIMIRKPIHLLPFSSQFFENMNTQRKTDSKSEFSQFLTNFNKQLDIEYFKEQTLNLPDSKDNKIDRSNTTLAETTGLRELLLPFSREFIRYTPSDYITFCWEYWSSLTESTKKHNEWLLHQTQLYEVKWKKLNGDQSKQPRSINEINIPLSSIHEKNKRQHIHIT